MDYEITASTPSQALIEMATLLIKEGRRVPSRQGEDTLEVTNVGLKVLHPTAREILVEPRKASIAAQIIETIWVLSGDDNIEFLLPYLPRAAEFSDDGTTWRGAYGPRLRGGVDQLKHVIELLKSDPGTRRAVINIYYGNLDTASSKDVPCNDFLMFLIRDGKLSMHVTTRSNDLIWGWSGINSFEWGTLLEVVAGLVGAGVGAIHYSIQSLHVYDKHLGRLTKIAGARPVDDTPGTWMVLPSSLEQFDLSLRHWRQIESDIRDGSGAWVNRLEEVSDPVLRDWLGVIAWYWHGDSQYVVDERLRRAMEMSYHPKRNTAKTDHFAEFLSEVIDLHNRKDAAYGDSWCRRGEQVSIQANIARKIDRLGYVGDQDESATDTAIDLMVYLAKYVNWLEKPLEFSLDGANQVLRSARPFPPSEVDSLESSLTEDFETLLDVPDVITRTALVRFMLSRATTLAYKRWYNDRVQQGNKTRAWNPEA